MKRKAEVSELELGAGGTLGVRHWSGRRPRRGPIVMLHGLLDDSRGWQPAAALSRRDMYAIDLPGFGRSSLPEHASVESMAARIHTGLEELGIDRCQLVGHSLGGAVAAQIADTSPDLISRLALISPAGLGELPIAELADSALGRRGLSLAPLVLANPLLSSLVYTLGVANGHPPSADLALRLMRSSLDVMPGARMAIRALARVSANGGQLAGGANNYSGPTESAWGERDRLIPLSHVKGFRRAFPRGRARVWKGIGHYPQQESPDLVGAIVSG